MIHFISMKKACSKYTAQPFTVKYVLFFRHAKLLFINEKNLIKT